MTVNLIVEVKTRWWLPVYIRMLTLFCTLMRCEPDYDKLRNLIIRHGISQNVRVVPCIKKE